jgi:hypothetical protein
MSNMPFGHIYQVELITLANNIYMRNYFHFKLQATTGSAFTVFDDFRSNAMQYLKATTSAYTRFYSVHARLVDQPLLDEYGELIEDEFGSIAATPADPRLGVWIQTRSAHTTTPFGTGGWCFGAIPYNWLQFPPKIEENGIDAWQAWRDNMMTAYAFTVAGGSLLWGIYSRVRNAQYPEDSTKYFFPITSARVRPTAVSRRTRRPRTPFS